MHNYDDETTILSVLYVTMMAVGSFAQDHMPGRVNTYSDEGTGTGFRKQNLFIGGSLGLGFATDNFQCRGQSGSRVFAEPVAGCGYRCEFQL